MWKRVWVSAGLVAALASLDVSVPSAQIRDTATDNACVVPRGRFGLPRPRGLPVPFLEQRLGIGDGPICQARSWEELLLLTGFMIDNAALSAAKGVDAAQEALGLARPLQAQVAQRERAAEGLAPKDMKETETLIKDVSAESLKLQAELATRKEAIAKDPAIQASLARAHQSLNEVAYFSGSAGAGGTLFGQFLQTGSAAANFLTLLDSQQVGIGSEFAKSLPDRAKRVVSTMDDTLALRATVESVLETPEKADDGSKRAKKRSEEAAKRTKEGLKPYKLTPRST